MGHHDGAAAVGGGAASGLAGSRCRRCRCATGAAVAAPKAAPHTGGEDQGKRFVVVLGSTISLKCYVFMLL